MTLGRRAALAGIAAALLATGCKRFLRRQHPDGGADGGSEAGADAGSRFGTLYRSNVGGFQIRFPEGKSPEVEEKRIPGAPGAVHFFKVQYGTSAFIVSYDDFAKGKNRTPEQTLDGAREAVLESTGGTIEIANPRALEGHPGLDLTVSATTSGIQMRQRVRVYLVAERLYQTIIVAPVWSGAASFEDDFLESFQLLNDGGP